MTLAARTLELSHDADTCSFGYLLGHGLRDVIEFGEGILFSLVGRHALA